MKHKTLAIAIASIAALTMVLVVVAFVMSAAQGAVQAEPDAAPVAAAPEGPIRYANRPMPAAGAPKTAGHMRIPADDVIVERMLKDANYIPADATPAQVEATLREFWRQWAARQTIPNPVKFRALMRNERLAAEAGVSPKALGLAQDDAIKTLAVAVEFAGTDVFTYSAPHPITPSLCTTAWATTTGPLHNEIVLGPRDNNTFWAEDFSPALYDEIYFGTGPTAGIVVTHPNVGKVDLTGLTVANFFLEQSEGVFTPTGMVYPKWLQASHSEGWYGYDDCTTGNRYPRARDLVRDTVDLINADDPNFPWQDFDADGDGKVDNYTVIHAGLGQESGGGEQGGFSLWSHAASVDWPDGYKACTAGSTGCPDRDIYVFNYSMDPENFDVGVGAEEYGHAALGLPDIYTTDYENSTANWIIMSAGSHNGPLGGMQSAPFPLYFRYVVGWSDPVELAYTTDFTEVVVGQLSLRPAGTEYGIKINLPDAVRYLADPHAGDYMWWGNQGDLMDNAVHRSLDLSGVTTATLGFWTLYEIEEGWDFGFVQVSTDGGTTWTSLENEDTTYDHDPGAIEVAVENLPGFTGHSGGWVYEEFDLTPYAGQSIMLQFRYITDWASTENGFFVDDISVTADTGVIFEDDVESGAGTWTADPAEDGWFITTGTFSGIQYYLVEWRNYSGFDEGLKYPYQTVWDSDPGERADWEVDRAPYHVPGALIWHRNTLYAFDYALGDSWYDDPSWGPKHALILVDSHPFPQSWDNYTYTSGANVRISPRVDARDAAFTLDDTTPFTMRLGLDPATGVYTDTPLETKVFPSRPAVSAFHDAKGYYPGLWCCDAEGYVYWWDIDASAVVPAMDHYSVRITDLYNEPFYALYGVWGELGSGNPGDDNVQYGVNIEVLDQASDGTWGRIAVYNQNVTFETTHTSLVEADAGDTYTVTYQTVVENAGTVAASDVYVSYTLDSELTFVSLTEDDGIGTVKPPVGTLVPPAWWTDELPAGATVTLTLKATGIAANGVVETVVEAYDGQTARGPWFFETTIRATTYIHLPIVMRSFIGTVVTP